MKKLLILSLISFTICTFNFKIANAQTNLDINSQIIKSLETDLTGDGKTENIILSGVSLNNSPLYENIKITISDNKTGATLFSIIPTTNIGYEPTIMLGDFTGDGLCELFYASSTNDKVGCYYLYAFNEDYLVLYDYESDITNCVATYEDWYKLKVYNEDNSYIVDLSNNSKELNSIYNDGKVIDNINAKISNAVKVFPYYDYSLNKYSLLVIRNITTKNSGVVLCNLVESLNFVSGENSLLKNSRVIV
jgi:hypothetical protein